MSAEVKSMKEWALYYAELGLAVFPLAYRNKVPAIEGGCKAATTEKSKIERWWNQNPRYNIGIATGNKSNGLVVIDLDVDKNKGIDGYEVLRDWQNKHGELPETWQSITGRGGYHYFYKDTITHSNKVGLYEGVDIRGEGGYIVAPPSVHPNGNTYEWEQEPKEYEIAQVDDIVNDFFKGEKQRIDSEHKTNFKVPELIPEGKRVDTIVRLIASLRTKGLDDDAIKAAVRVENEKRCNPPLKEKELEKAVFPALKRDWQVNSPYYNNFNAMNENDNKYVNEVLKKLNELNAVERFPMNDRGSADLFATIFKNEDYGFSEDEDKRLGEFCKNLEMRDKILLLQCAAEVYPNIIDELYCCIVIGMSYDKMNKKKFVALDRKDFYAYRKKTLAVFRAALQACNRYPF